MDRLLRGAINDLVVTPGQSVTTSGMRSRFRPQVVHLRQFVQYCKMDQSLHGATDTGAAEASGSELSVKTSIRSNRFRLDAAHLLPPSQTAQMRHGAIRTGLIAPSHLSRLRHWGGDSSSVQDQFAQV